mmetsp:Transcript_43703/g.64037  ORF Transcript_43703/g.64037 Transcript_43703/m.64037 type:complete len:86 (+) Transcript_43703:203-460(+)
MYRNWHHYIDFHMRIVFLLAVQDRTAGTFGDIWCRDQRIAQQIVHTCVTCWPLLEKLHSEAIGEAVQYYLFGGPAKKKKRRRRVL